MLEAIRKHIGDEPGPWEWIAGLWRPDLIAKGVPHPTVYDGPHLLVTGTSAKIAAEATASAADRRLVSGRQGATPSCPGGGSAAADAAGVRCSTFSTSVLKSSNAPRAATA